MKLPAGRFYGSVRRQRDVAGFVLVEKLHLPEEVLGAHSHECAYFSFVLEGGYTERCGRTVQDLYPGSLAFHPEEETHSDHFHRTGGRLFDLQLTPTSIARLGEAGIDVRRSMQTRTELPAWLLLRLYDEFRASDAASSISIEGLTLELLASLARSGAELEPAPRTGWLEETAEFVRRHFTEPISLNLLARRVGIHPVHLAREFRKRHHCTLGDYVRRLRIDLACRRLTATDQKITTIALDSGFADHSHLARTFKRHTGLSPSQFRKRFRAR